MSSLIYHRSSLSLRRRSKPSTSTSSSTNKVRGALLATMEKLSFTTRTRRTSKNKNPKRKSLRFAKQVLDGGDDDDDYSCYQ